MKTILKPLLKGILIIILTFTVFILLKNIFAQVGGMPQSFKNAYPESYFIKTGTFYPAIILLMIMIFIHLLLNYICLQKTIPYRNCLKGLLYGAAFGILWFFGFLELVFTYHSDFFRHASSGLRDLLSLIVFGILAGIFFTTKTPSIEKHREAVGVMLYTAIFFTVFHGAQYYLTFTAIKQQVDDISIVFWLLGTGAWIGLMYYGLSPKMENILKKTMFFACNTFGINWFLYTSFYHLFLDIPVLDLLIRCGFDIAGIFLGLFLYEYAKAKSGLIASRDKR